MAKQCSAMWLQLFVKVNASRSSQKGRKMQNFLKARKLVKLRTGQCVNKQVLLAR